MQTSVIGNVKIKEIQKNSTSYKHTQKENIKKKINLGHIIIVFKNEENYQLHNKCKSKIYMSYIKCICTKKLPLKRKA